MRWIHLILYGTQATEYGSGIGMGGWISIDWAKQSKATKRASKRAHGIHSTLLHFIERAIGHFTDAVPFYI